MTNNNPSAPRKNPSQKRSKMLVSSVIEACQKILENEGPERLTAAHLADICGISVGSLYQYFPNIEAVVAEFFKNQFITETAAIETRRQNEFQGPVLEETVRLMVKTAVAYHRRMFSFHPEFYRKYHDHYALRQGSSSSLLNLLERHQQTRGIEEPQMKAFLLRETMSSFLQNTIEEHPEYLEKDQFEETLFSMTMGVINPNH